MQERLHSKLGADMYNYDPAARSPGLRDVIIAWIVAVAICAALLATPELARMSEESDGRASLDAAIDEAVPRDANLLADREPSP